MGGQNTISTTFHHLIIRIRPYWPCEAFPNSLLETECSSSWFSLKTMISEYARKIVNLNKPQSTFVRNPKHRYQLRHNAHGGCTNRLKIASMGNGFIVSVFQIADRSLRRLTRNSTIKFGTQPSGFQRTLYYGP